MSDHRPGGPSRPDDLGAPRTPGQSAADLPYYEGDRIGDRAPRYRRWLLKVLLVLVIVAVALGGFLILSRDDDGGGADTTTTTTVEP